MTEGTSTERKISRKDFLAALGGAAAGVVLFKFTSIKKVIATIEGVSDSEGMYGVGPYGGKKIF